MMNREIKLINAIIFTQDTAAVNKSNEIWVMSTKDLLAKSPRDY